MTENKRGYWLIMDSYPETNEEVIKSNMEEFGLTYNQAKFIKKLDWQYPFFFAKNYYIKENKEKKSLFALIRDFIKRYFNFN